MRFDSAGSWGFDNDTARNVLIFCVDNSSSSYADNRKNNFLVLGEGPTFRINGSFGSPEKNVSINFSKANINFFLSSHLLTEPIHPLKNTNTQFPTCFQKYGFLIYGCY